jgi:hypothetical protein
VTRAAAFAGDLEALALLAAVVAHGVTACVVVAVLAVVL